MTRPSTKHPFLAGLLSTVLSLGLGLLQVVVRRSNDKDWVTTGFPFEWYECGSAGIPKARFLPLLLNVLLLGCGIWLLAKLLHGLGLWSVASTRLAFATLVALPFLPAISHGGWYLLAVDATVVSAEDGHPIEGALVMPFPSQNYSRAALSALERQAFIQVDRGTFYLGAPCNAGRTDVLGRTTFVFCERQVWRSTAIGFFLRDRPLDNSRLLNDTLVAFAPGRQPQVVPLAVSTYITLTPEPYEALSGRIEGGVIPLSIALSARETH